MMPLISFPAPVLAARDMVLDPSVVAVIGTATVYFLIILTIAATAFFILFLLVKLFNKRKTHKECFAITCYLSLMMPFTWPYHLYHARKKLRNRKAKQKDVESGKFEGTDSSSSLPEASKPTIPNGFTPQHLHSRPVSDSSIRFHSLDLTEVSAFNPDLTPKPRHSVRSHSVHSTTGTGHSSGDVSVSPMLPGLPVSTTQSIVQQPVSSYELPPPTLCLGELYFEQERNLVGGENAEYFAGEGVGKTVKESLSDGAWAKGERIKSLEAEHVRHSDGTFDTIIL